MCNTKGISPDAPTAVFPTFRDNNETPPICFVYVSHSVPWYHYCACQPLFPDHPVSRVPDGGARGFFDFPDPRFHHSVDEGPIRTQALVVVDCVSVNNMSVDAVHLLLAP